MFKDIAMATRLDVPGDAMDREILGTILLLEKQWTEGPHDDIDLALRLLGNKCARARRELSMKSEHHFNLYNLGRLQGCMDVLAHLMKAELENPGNRNSENDDETR